MPADFLANDFAGIAHAMRREAPTPQETVLHFWDMSSLLTSTHKNIKAAVEGAYVLVASETGIPVCITALDGTVLMNTAALAEAVIRYKERMPT